MFLRPIHAPYWEIGETCEDFSTERDTMMVRFRANTSVKRRGSPTGPDWTVETIGELEDVVLTMRLAMGVASFLLY